MESVAFVIATRPDGLQEINLPAALSSLSLRVRLFEATEAALLSRMMVFTAVLLKARIFCHNETSTGKQLPTDEDNTARQNFRNCLSTSRNVRQDLNCRCSSAKRLRHSVISETTFI
jgi:hypothetical protein